MFKILEDSDSMVLNIILLDAVFAANVEILKRFLTGNDQVHTEQGAFVNSNSVLSG